MRFFWILCLFLLVQNELLATSERSFNDGYIRILDSHSSLIPLNPYETDRSRYQDLKQLLIPLFESVLSSQSVSKTFKVRFFKRKSASFAFTPVMYIAFFRERELFYRVKAFLVEEGSFDEEDHMLIGAYAVEVLVGRKLKIFNRTLRFPYCSGRRTDDRILQEICAKSELAFLKARRNGQNPYTASIQRAISYIQEGSGDEKRRHRRKLSRSVKRIQGSFFSAYMNHLLDRYLREQPEDELLDISRVEQELLGEDFQNVRDTFSPEVYEKILVEVRFMALSHGDDMVDEDMREHGVLEGD